MGESQTDTPILSSGIGECETIYQPPVRPSGIVTLLLGMLCSLIILNRGFLPLAVVVVLLGLFAMRPAPAGTPVGRRAAMLGILLAIFFLALGWTRSAIIERDVSRSAEKFALHWLKLAEMGEWELVYELTNPPSSRQNPRMPLKAHYLKLEKAQELSEYKEQEFIQMFAELTHQPHWELAERPRISRSSGDYLVSLQFTDRNNAFPNQTLLTMQRVWQPQEDHFDWMVKSHELR